MKDANVLRQNRCKYATFECSGSICWLECKLKDCVVTHSQCERCKDKEEVK